MHERTDRQGPATRLALECVEGDLADRVGQSLHAPMAEQRGNLAFDPPMPLPVLQDHRMITITNR